MTDSNQSSTNNEPEFTNKCVVKNQTAYRISIALKKDSTSPSFQISPFGTCKISPDVYNEYNFNEWQRHGLIKLDHSSAKHQDESSDKTTTIIENVIKDSFKELLWKSPYYLVIILIGWGAPLITIAFLGYESKWIDPPSIAFLGRAMQFIYIGIASTLPATLYIIFGRQKLNLVEEKFKREILMLDPSVVTKSEAKEKYGMLFSDVHGLSGSSQHNLRGAGLPLIIATILITLGWVLTLLPIGELSVFEASHLMTLFTPPAQPMVFGFLGAYFFSLNMIFRRYVRGDLTPKTFNHISVRLVSTTILVWVITEIVKVISDGSVVQAWLLALAFIIGIIPESGTTYIQETARKRPNLGGLIKFFNKEDQDLRLDDEHALTKLEGITIYDRARFQEEGINNIENLAHHNLIELIARIGLTTQRIVDLFDQAILYLHLGLNEEDLDWSRQVLRSYGIRKATDLVNVYKKKPCLKNLILDRPKQNGSTSNQGDKTPTEGNGAESGEIVNSGNEIASDIYRSMAESLNSKPIPTKIETIHAAIEEDEWISNLQYWCSFRSQGGKSADLSYFLRLKSLAHDQDEASESLSITNNCD